MMKAHNQPATGRTVTDGPLPPDRIFAVEVAQRLELAQAKRLTTAPALVGDRELNEGQRIHSNVSKEQLDAIARAYKDAQRSFIDARFKLSPEGGTRVLMAPTNRVVDYSVDAKGVQVLIEELIKQGRKEDLEKAIACGPERGFVWEKAEDPVTLMASIIRWVGTHGRDKVRLSASPSVRAWIHEVLTASLDGEGALKPRIGGISAANALQGSALKDRVTMMALGSMPRGVAALLPPQLRVVADDPTVSHLQELPTGGESAGHFAVLSDKGGDSLLPQGMPGVTISGEVVERSQLCACDVLITGSSCVRDFGSLSLERSQLLGRLHDVVILTGVQYLTDNQACAAFLKHVSALHSSGAAISLSYSEVKKKESEFSIWGAIKASNAVDLLSMNAGEAYQFILRLAANRMGPLALGLSPDLQAQVCGLAQAGGRHPSTPWENAHEDPVWIADAALVLQSILRIPVVRVRGKVGDVTVTEVEVADGERHGVVQDLIQSRIMAVLKTANPKGLLTQFTDLAYVRNVPSGSALAGLHTISERLIAGGADAGEGATLPVKMVCGLPDGRTLFAVPPTDMYVKDGGTASAGDLIDYTFASQQSKKLLRAAHDYQQERRTCDYALSVLG